MVDQDAFEESCEVILFWSPFVHEVALCNGTGRVLSIKEYEINVRLPTDYDVAVVRAGLGSEQSPIYPEVYPEMVRMMLHVARSIDFLNTGARQISSQSPQENRDPFNRVEDIKTSMARAYQSLSNQVSFGGEFTHARVSFL